MQRGATKHSTAQQQSSCHCQPAAHRDLPPSVLYVCECACVSLRCCSDLFPFPLPLFLSLSLPSSPHLHIPPSGPISAQLHPHLRFPTPSYSIPLAPRPSAVALPLPLQPCLSAHSRSSWPNPPDPGSGAGSSHTPSPPREALPTRAYKEEVRPISRMPLSKNRTNQPSAAPANGVNSPGTHTNSLLEALFVCG